LYLLLSVSGQFDRLISISNPLHILQEYLLAAAVVELRGPALGVAGDPLGGFKGAVIFQKICNVGCAE
jgi:hypothetical protein